MGFFESDPHALENLLWISGADGYRLPTEAEWEWAARGGVKSKRYFYDIDKVAWWYGDKTDSFGCHPVADKKANELGIYDMSGNVMELCWDMRNSRHPVRGGSWKDYSYDCHIHDRSTRVAAIYCSNEIGFRVARNLRSKTESHG